MGVRLSGLSYPRCFLVLRKFLGKGNEHHEVFLPNEHHEVFRMNDFKKEIKEIQTKLSKGNLVCKHKWSLYHTRPIYENSTLIVYKCKKCGSFLQEIDGKKTLFIDRTGI